MSDPRPAALLRDITGATPVKVLPRPSRHAATALATGAGAVAPQASPQAMPPAQVLSTEALGYKDGYRDGHDNGLRDGLRDAQRQIDEHLAQQVQKLDTQAAAQAEQQRQEHAERLQRLDQLMNGLATATSARLEQLEPAAVALAFEAVCTLLGEHATTPDTVAALVRHAMRQLRGGTLLAVRLHPADLAQLSGSPAGASLAERFAHVRFEADLQSARGSCVLVSDRGSLDASLLAQLDRLRLLWREEGHTP